MSHQEITAALRKPFPSDRIEWRVAMCGTGAKGVWARVLAYIDNRAAMERLDDVLGPYWSQEERFETIGNAAVCTVTIKIEGVEGYPTRTVTGSCAVEANGDIDQFKSAASGAMKRAVVQLGVGRYLYELPEAWAEITDAGAFSAKTKDGTWFKWNPPKLPDWALPEWDEGEKVSPASTFNQAQEAPARPAAPAPAHASPAAPVQAPAAQDTDDVWGVQIHFGKNKGKALRDLPEFTLKWYLNEWKPQPFKGKLSQNDVNLRAALDKIKGVEVDPGPSHPAIPEDDGVPF